MKRKNRFADAVRMPQKRITPKSAFLKKLERQQKEVAADNRKLRVVTLRTAYSRRRDE